MQFRLKKHYIPVLFSIGFLLLSVSIVFANESGNALATGPLSPEKKIKLKYPVVFLHGASVGGKSLKIGPLHLGDYWQRLPKYVEDLGIKVAVPELPKSATIAYQATVLHAYLKRHYPNQKVNLIGHSMGGLVARFLASQWDKDQTMVASIVSVATPHRGSGLSDWAFRQKENRSVMYWLLRACGYNLDEREFLIELTPKYMSERFNPNVKDVEGVIYYSVQAWGEPWTRTLSPFLYVPHYLNKWEENVMSEEPNDGLVPLSSQKWGKVIAKVQLDHLAQINHHPLRFSMEEETKALYQRILEQLAKDGL